MRVVQILPSLRSGSGGPPRSTLATCRAVHAADPKMETVLVSTDEGLTEEWRTEIAQRCPPRTTLRIFPGLGSHTTMFSVPLLAWLHSQAEHFDLAVIRALLHPLSSAAARVVRSRQLPYVLVPHGTLSRYTFDYSRSRLKRLYYRAVDDITVARASAVQFTARTERDEAQRLGLKSPSVVIAHPYEPQFDSSDPKPDGIHQILFMARFDAIKRIPVVLKAMAHVKVDVPSACLILAGSGSEQQEREIRLLLEELGLHDSVELPGFVTGQVKRRLLRESALFVLPSVHENFGVSVVEAMDAGLPVVISRGVQIWPEIEAAGAGIALEKCTPETLARSIVGLLGDEERRRAMGRAGQRLVRSAFDPGRVGLEISRLYHAAAQGSGRVQEIFG